jgi:ribosomal protein L11 methyltransferase
MTYTQVTIHLYSDDTETLTDYLFYIGCSGTEVIDHQTLTEAHDDHFGEIYSLNPSDYPEEGTLLKAYFHDRFDGEQIDAEIRHVIETNGIRLLSDEIKIEIIAGEDYAETWKDQIHAVEVNPTISIIAPWMEVPAGKLAIQIEPGLGFGTGSHPTTKMCLDLLSHYMKDNDQVIDLGCGSGIIAILASKLSKGDVYGIDLDPDALKNAKYNAALNQVEIGFFPTMDVIKEPVDILVANIVFDILKVLMDDIYSHVKPEGICIFSGITKSQAEDMKTLLSSHFILIEERQEKEFVAFVLRKKG